MDESAKHQTKKGEKDVGFPFVTEKKVTTIIPQALTL